MMTTLLSRALRSAPTITSSPRSGIRRLASTSLLVTIIAITCGTRAPATVVGTGLVEQPIYLGSASQPDRKDGEAPPPIAVPGLSLEKTALGVRYLVFDGVSAKAAIKRRDPVFIPFRHEGETEDIQGAYLIPVWHGDAWAEPLNLLTTPYLPYYEKWSSGATGRNPEQAATPYLAPPNPLVYQHHFDVVRSPDQTTVSFRPRDCSPGEFAAIVCACILTVQPTEERPMVVEIAEPPELESYRKRMLADPAWENGRSCTFVFDPATLTLTKGSVPGFVLRKERGQLVVLPEAAEEGHESGAVDPQ